MLLSVLNARFVESGLMDTAVRILCDVAGADSAVTNIIVDRSLPVLAQVMSRREIDDMVYMQIGMRAGNSK